MFYLLEKFRDDHYISLHHLPAAPRIDSGKFRKQNMIKKDYLIHKSTEVNS